MNVAEVAPAALLLGTVAVIVGLRVVSERRARRRFLAGLCTTCGSPLSSDESYRIEGRVVCGDCARQVRPRLQRVLWGVFASAAALLVLTVIGTWKLWSEGDPTWWLFPSMIVGVTGFLGWLLVSTMRFMKLENITGELVDRAHLQIELLRPPEPPKQV